MSPPNRAEGCLMRRDRGLSNGCRGGRKEGNKTDWWADNRERWLRGEKKTHLTADPRPFKSNGEGDKRERSFEEGKKK